MSELVHKLEFEADLAKYDEGKIPGVETGTNVPSRLVHGGFQ